MATRFESLLSWIALPVYVWQGLGVRRRSMRLQPPPKRAIIELPGNGNPLKILFVGDSSAAGVGVEDFAHSVAGRLPALLNQELGRPIYQRTAGNNSATSAHLRDYVVPNLERNEYDIIILSIGTNDAKNFHSTRRFCKEFGSLIYALRARFPGAAIVWQGMIDMQGVPILPWPLNVILGIRSRLLRKAGKQLCYERGALAPDTSWQPLPENFSRDGFHASERGYDLWAQELASFIADQARSV